MRGNLHIITSSYHLCISPLCSHSQTCPSCLQPWEDWVGFQNWRWRPWDQSTCCRRETFCPPGPWRAPNPTSARTLRRLTAALSKSRVGVCDSKLILLQKILLLFVFPVTFYSCFFFALLLSSSLSILFCPFFNFSHTNTLPHSVSLSFSLSLSVNISLCQQPTLPVFLY